MCSGLGIHGELDIAQISWRPDYDSFFYHQLSRRSRRIYLFRGEYIFDLEKALLFKWLLINKLLIEIVATDEQFLLCLERNYAGEAVTPEPAAETLAKLPVIAARTWEARKEQHAADAKMLARRLEEQRALNLRTIKAKVDGKLSEEDFQTMKKSVADEIARIETSIAALDAEKASYEEVLQQSESEVINLEQAWREGDTRRKREIQNALFPEGLAWWIKRRVFETTQGLSIEDFWDNYDSYCTVGVPGGI